MKPGIFVSVILGLFACVMFPPLAIVAALALVVVGAQRATKSRSKRRADAAAMERVRAYHVQYFDQQAPVMNPGWRL